MSFLFEASYHKVCARDVTEPVAFQRARRARPISPGTHAPTHDWNLQVNQKNGVSPFQNLCAYLGGSAIQTVGDNPVTAYRQLVQQFAKNAQGQTVSPKEAVAEANAVFRAAPISASLSGLWPQMTGVLLNQHPMIFTHTHMHT